MTNEREKKSRLGFELSASKWNVSHLRCAREIMQLDFRSIKCIHKQNAPNPLLIINESKKFVSVTI